MAAEVVFNSMLGAYLLTGFWLLKFSLSSPTPKLIAARIRARN